MPAKGKTEWNSNNANFADVKLTAADKDAFDQWFSSANADLEVWFQNMIDDSYRVSLKFDYNNSCYQCALTQQDAKHINANLIIISRAGSVEESFLLCCYKVSVLYEGQRLPSQSEGNNSWG